MEQIKASVGEHHVTARLLCCLDQVTCLLNRLDLVCGFHAVSEDSNGTNDGPLTIATAMDQGSHRKRVNRAQTIDHSPPSGVDLSLCASTDTAVSLSMASLHFRLPAYVVLYGELLTFQGIINPSRYICVQTKNLLIDILDADRPGVFHVKLSAKNLSAATATPDALPHAASFLEPANGKG